MLRAVCRAQGADWEQALSLPAGETNRSTGSARAICGVLFSSKDNPTKSSPLTARLKTIRLLRFIFDSFLYVAGRSNGKLSGAAAYARIP